MLDSLVIELLDKETLDKAQIAEVFEPLRRRPVRPAWTGSPQPGAVQHPAGATCPESGGSRQRLPPDEAEGAIVLTPPGSGGDIHGDPGAPHDRAAEPSMAVDRISQDAAPGHPGLRPRPGGGGGPRAADRGR